MVSIQAQRLPNGFAFAVTRRQLAELTRRSPVPVKYIRFAGTSPSLRQRHGPHDPGIWLFSVNICRPGASDDTREPFASMTAFGARLGSIGDRRNDLARELVGAAERWLHAQALAAVSAPKAVAVSLDLYAVFGEASDSYQLLRRES